MTQSNHPTTANAASTAYPTPVPVMAQSPPTKQGLKKWWASFKNSPKPEPQAPAASHIFGVPLRQSITYANVAISLIDSEGRSYIYGYVPIIVAKCGVYLKEQATETQGIFRLSGSEKRIKELKTIFDSPERYGKGLDWSGYNVHDAANVLRRYLNELPEPIIPLDLYERFREPLRGVTTGSQQRSIMENQQPVEVPQPDFDMDQAIATYQQLITELPPLNRQLLLYILDLLAVFASKSEVNLMTPSNLAAIFQPCMLNHPDHDMSPTDYILNQNVLIFLIENQDHFLIGMSGTAADEQTVQQVQKGGTPPQGGATTPTRSKTTIARSASTASAGAESVLRNGAIRRNASTASRHSRQSNGTSTPTSPALTATSASGIHRSNTVPSKRSPGLSSGRLQKGAPSPLTPTTPTRVPSSLATPEIIPASPPDPVKPELSRTPSSVTPTAGVDHTSSSRSQERLLEPEIREEATPAKERSVTGLFQRSPGSDTEKRQPNKLRKKRIPGSANVSAQSSTNSLHSARDHLSSPLVEAAVPSTDIPDHVEPLPAQHSEKVIPVIPEVPTNAAAKADAPSAASIRSHSSTNDHNDHYDQSDGDVLSGGEQPEKKSRWRFKRRRDDSNTLAATFGTRKALGANGGADVSSTSINSASHTTKTITGETSASHTDSAFSTSHLHSSTESAPGHEGKDERKGPIDWLKNKLRDRDAEKERNKSPPASDRGTSSSHLPSRGKSVELRRDDMPPPAAPPTSTPVPLQTQSLAVAEPSAPVEATPEQNKAQEVVAGEPSSTSTPADATKKE